MAKMTYKMSLAQGITLEKITIMNKEVDLEKDKVSATEYKNEDGYEAYVVDGKANVYVEAYGIDGSQWALEVKIDGNKLTSEPITQKVGADGNTTGNAHHNEDYPY